MSSYPTRNRKFQKTSKKIQKIRKHNYSFFSSQNKLEKAKKGRKKKKSFRWVPTRIVIENSKKIANKLQKLENTIIASFQAKRGWERPRKREKKKSFWCVPTQPIIDNSKKIRKIRKHHHNFFSSQNRMGMAEKERE